MKEIFVRRYDQKIPPVPLLDEARALLVIGLHADRRSVQARARAKGMKIFFIDPEGLMENGTFKEYPIEGAREGDTIVRSEATPAPPAPVQAPGRHPLTVNRPEAKPPDTCGPASATAAAASPKTSPLSPTASANSAPPAPPHS